MNGSRRRDKERLSAMPILPPEPNCFPEGLFENGQPHSTAGREWWVLHTKPRQEKSLARQMCETKIPFYLPLISKRSPSRGRVTTSLAPLFAGYVFLLATREERIAALTTQRIVNTLIVKDQQALWHDLRQVHRLIATGKPITPEQRLAPGHLVEIKSGPLAGLHGKIIRTASGQRFVVQVNFIQQGASVLMDDYNLEKIEAAELEDHRS